jgi:hypothetical protein
VLKFVTCAEGRATAGEQLERRVSAKARAEGLAPKEAPLLFAFCAGFGLKAVNSPLARHKKGGGREKIANAYPKRNR